MRTYAQLTTSFVVFCNRVGVDESISFWGGSEVIAPTGAPIFSAPFYDEGLFSVDIAPADIRRERIGLPLLRDERPGAAVARARADRAGAGRPGRGLDRSGRAGMSGAAAGLRTARRARHRHRRRAAGHRRVHPRPARPGRLRAGRPGPLGRHRLGARRVPRGRGDRSGEPAVRADAVPDVVAGLAHGCRDRRGGPRLRQRAGRHQPDRRRLLRGGRGRRPVARRAPSGAATSWPGPGWPSCTTGR